MSNLIYNGIWLQPIKTVEVEETPVYTEDGLDFLWMKWRITVEALYSPSMTSYGLDEVGNPIQEPGVWGPDTDEAVRFYLMQPRRQLTYSFVLPRGSSSIMVSPGNAPDGGMFETDANNGPIPISTRIVRVDGNKVFHIVYTVETCVTECGSDSLLAIVSNRFSQTVDLDDRHFMVKTTSGRAYFRTDLLEDDGVTADTFRSFILPPVSRGLRRTNIKVTVATSGNVLDWTTVDREFAFDLGETSPLTGGSGVIDINADYMISTMTGDGGHSPLAVAECRIDCAGNRYSTNWILIQAALTIATTRLPVAQPQVGLLRHVSIRSSLTDRRVSVSLAYMLTAPGAGVPMMNQLPLDALRQPSPFADADGANPSFPNDGGSRGTQLEQIVTQALQDACGDIPTAAGADDSIGFGSTATIEGGVPAIEVQAVDYLPPTSTSFSQDTPPTAEYRIHSSYFDDRGYRQVTPTGDGNESSDVIKVRSRSSQRIVNWTAESWGAPPIVPRPDSSDSNQVLLHSTLGMMNVVGLPDGQSVAYRVSGQYIYAMIDPVGAGDTIAFDVPPWLTYVWGEDSSYALMNLYDEEYEHGLIDSAVSGDLGSGNGSY